MFLCPPRLTAILALAAFTALPWASPAARAYEPPTAPAPRPFTYPGDTFDFKNETVWNYVGGGVAPETDHAHVREYTRRCFVLARASVQFWKFARFDPTLPPLPAPDLARRIRDVCGRSVWLPALAPRDRVVIPGYHDLREASAKMRYVFEANIGRGWPFYFRRATSSSRRGSRVRRRTGSTAKSFMTSASTRRRSSGFTASPR
ncbi:MAG: hypothetical protein WDO13_13425 [Verrucomicrobiota bacterium]